jgi:hypothetical protein
MRRGFDHGWQLREKLEYIYNAFAPSATWTAFCAACWFLSPVTRGEFVIIIWAVVFCFLIIAGPLSSWRLWKDAENDDFKF